jgi:hypothetical protein
MEMPLLSLKLSGQIKTVSAVCYIDKFCAHNYVRDTIGVNRDVIFVIYQNSYLVAMNILFQFIVNIANFVSVTILV